MSGSLTAEANCTVCPTTGLFAEGVTESITGAFPVQFVTATVAVFEPERPSSSVATSVTV